jgi:hypothetical protein
MNRPVITTQSEQGSHLASAAQRRAFTKLVSDMTVKKVSERVGARCKTQPFVSLIHVFRAFCAVRKVENLGNVACDYIDKS